MAYVKCPSCQGNNRDTDSKCYLCGSELVPAAISPAEQNQADLSASGGVEDPSRVGCLSTLVSFFLPLVISIGVGFGLGTFWDKSEVGLSLGVKSLILALTCSLLGAFVSWAAANTEVWRLVSKLGQVVSSGALIGICWAGMQWGFGFEVTGAYMGGMLGLLAGLPIALFLRPKVLNSRILGKEELFNLGVALGLAVLAALVVLAFGGEYSTAIGLISCGLGLAVVCGGRINISDMAGFAVSAVAVTGEVGAAYDRHTRGHSSYTRESYGSRRFNLSDVFDFFT